MADAISADSLVAKVLTVDKARMVLRFEKAIGENAPRSAEALTASRGRCKSAAIGSAVPSPLSMSSRISSLPPTPENLRTFFTFLFSGFD